MIPALKDVGEVVAEVLMTRTNHAGSFLLLEGPDDGRFWEPRVSRRACDVVIAGTRLSVERAMLQLDRQAFRGAVGLSDDDGDRLLHVPLPSPNLVRTEARDLEGLLLRSSALDKVLAEFAIRAKVVQFEANGVSVRDALLALGAPIGRLRLLTRALEWAGVLPRTVDWERIQPHRFVRSGAWKLDEQALHAEVGLQVQLPSQPLLQAALTPLAAADPWQVCRGHDLVKILGIGLERVLGDKNPGERHIGSVLRSALQDREFQSMELYRNLRAWEDGNVPYQVLP